MPKTHKFLEIIGGGKCPINGFTIKFIVRATRKTYLVNGRKAEKLLNLI